MTEDLNDLQKLLGITKEDADKLRDLMHDTSDNYYKSFPRASSGFYYSEDREAVKSKIQSHQKFSKEFIESARIEPLNASVFEVINRGKNPYQVIEDLCKVIKEQKEYSTQLLIKLMTGVNKLDDRSQIKT